MFNTSIIYHRQFKIDFQDSLWLNESPSNLKLFLQKTSIKRMIITNNFLPALFQKIFYTYDIDIFCFLVSDYKSCAIQHHNINKLNFKFILVVNNNLISAAAASSSVSLVVIVFSVCVWV